MKEKSLLWQVSEVKVTYHNPLFLAHRPKITSSRDSESVLRANWSDDMEFIEEFLVMLLGRSNQVKGLFKVSRGGMSATVVDTRIIFATALKGMATALILAHNHPSGHLQPSQSDLDLTKKLRKAGEILEISVLDHLILAPQSGYYSFADEGML